MLKVDGTEAMIFCVCMLQFGATFEKILALRYLDKLFNLSVETNLI